MKLDDMLQYVRVKPGKKFRLKDHDPAWAGDKEQPKDERKKFAQDLLDQDVSSLAGAQDLLYADDRYAILVILQAMDAAGKDGTIKHVMSGLNPQGCHVNSFKQPSQEELDHHFLWRCSKVLPPRGTIGIFNRSYYEEVLVVKVHPEYLANQRLPDIKVNDKFWKGRYDDINAFEENLARNGTIILKFFLNVSKGEQRNRFLERINDPTKHWKFSDADLSERGYWKDYMAAYEECLAATSTSWAPWYVIPADHKWVSRAMVAKILAQKIQSLDLAYPVVSADKLKKIEAAKKQLEAD